MRNRSKGFGEQQAFFGSTDGDPSSPRLAHHRVVIEIVVKAQKRQLKAVLPPLLPMTGPGVATKASHVRLNIAFEIEQRGRQISHGHRDLRHTPLGFNANDSGPGTDGSHYSRRIDRDHVRRFRGEASNGGRPIGPRGPARAGNKQLLARIVTAQRDGRRVDDQPTFGLVGENRTAPQQETNRDPDHVVKLLTDAHP